MWLVLAPLSGFTRAPFTQRAKGAAPSDTTSNPEQIQLPCQSFCEISLSLSHAGHETLSTESLTKSAPTARDINPLTRPGPEIGAGHSLLQVQINLMPDSAPSAMETTHSTGVNYRPPRRWIYRRGMKCKDWESCICPSFPE